MRDINKIILHCSDSDFGDAAVIHEWHLQRGFSKIGYHYVITNCYKSYQSLKDRIPDMNDDGAIEYGRSVEKIGAHCRGQNTDSLGICLIGVNTFTSAQIKTLYDLLLKLYLRYKISPENIFGHYEFSNKKSCPNIDMDFVREEFKKTL